MSTLFPSLKLTQFGLNILCSDTSGELYLPAAHNLQAWVKMHILYASPALLCNPTSLECHAEVVGSSNGQRISSLQEFLLLVKTLGKKQNKTKNTT